MTPRRLLLFTALFLWCVIIVFIYASATQEAEGMAVGSLVSRGTVNFIISSDSAGRHPITTLNWGQIAVGVKNTRTFYVVNRSYFKIVANVSLEGWNWQTTNPANDVLVNVKFSSTAPISYGKYVKVTVEQTLLRPINSLINGVPQTNFSYLIAITGTQAK
jgi:hypothetical protein